MKKYTEDDLKSFKIIDGYLICPTGDYSDIKSFRGHCKFCAECNFGTDCSFGECCRFGTHCRFGADCSFREYCGFGKYCTFETCCRFGEECRFGAHCSFGTWCSFRADCGFRKKCSFGECCSFGERCCFEKGCIIENSINLVDFLKFEGFGSEKRCIYFFLDVNKNIFVRCGCFFGSLKKFRKQVKKTHGDSKYGIGYLKMADLAEWQLLN